ncbi:MAG: RHS repeat protein, partial [Pseudomonadales bacterium]|nr:RHS repeat protein [Pseudomonadales bacterium]
MITLDTTRLEYSDRGEVTAITYAEGVTTTYTYDGLDNLLAEDSTASGLTRHRYDAAGNRIETVDARGVVTQYDYDALNRLTAVRYPSSPQENIDYRYDEGVNGTGRLTSIDDPSGETAFTYDERGNLITDTRMIDGVHYTTRYEYNRANQMTELIYPSGRIVHYRLDGLSRVTAITTQANAAAPQKVVAEDFDYLPFGPATGWTHGNGLDTDIDYNRDYRITDIDVQDMDEIMSLTYQYSDVSNITRILDNLGANDQQFGYDALNRLTHAEGNYGNIDYSYDSVGNRQTRTIEQDGERTEESYVYEAGSHRIDRVTTTDNDGIETRQFRHDDNGNIVEDISGERSIEMIVNARNRLQAIIKDGEQVGEYEYNALGQRVAKTSRYRGRLHAHFDNGNNNVVLSDSEGPQNGKVKNNDEGANGSRRNADGLHS